MESGFCFKERSDMKLMSPQTQHRRWRKLARFTIANAIALLTAPV
jgi:hypothetical protein